MERSRAWVLNFDADEELAALAAGASAHTPARAVLARFEALAARVQALLGPGDRVIVPRATAGALEGLPDAFVGRAWCPTPRALQAFQDAGIEAPEAPPLAVIQRVNHRRFAADLGQTLPEARFVEAMDALIETIAAPSPTGHWLLKRPFGFAGRGRRKVRAGSIDPSARAWIEASLGRRPGQLGAMGIQVEPWVERSLDCAIHGFLARSGELTLGEPTVQSTDPSGAWLGSARAREGDLSRPERAALFDAAEASASALFAAGYTGPFGIDAFRWIDASGAAQFNPRCEINARYSMGWAIGMGDRRPDLAID